MPDQMPPTYPKGDLRRMLLVLGALDTAPGATLVQLAVATGLDKKTITSLIRQAGEQAWVTITKDGPAYRLENWGPVLKKSGAKMALTGALNAL